MQLSEFPSFKKKRASLRLPLNGDIFISIQPCNIHGINTLRYFVVGKHCAIFVQLELRVRNILFSVKLDWAELCPNSSLWILLEEPAPMLLAWKLFSILVTA